MVDTSQFSKCVNGHLFDPQKHAACPHCPLTASSNQHQPASATRFVGTQVDTANRPDSRTTPNRGMPSGPGATVVESASNNVPAKRGADTQGTVVENVQDRSAESGDRKTRILGAEDKEVLKPIFAWLVVMEGPHQYEVFRIDQEQTYVGGSANNDIVLHDEFISSEHISIRHREGQFFITDLDSSNGTFVNDFSPQARIDRAEVKDGDEVRIAQMRIIFKCV